jgi:hypothetical protein
MMLEWNTYHARILKTLAEPGRLSPDAGFTHAADASS